MEAIFPGAKLRELREAKGYTQSQLDDAAELKRGSVRDYEQGIRQPQWGRVIALCAALGVECSAFMVSDADTTKLPTPKAGRGRPRKSDEQTEPAANPEPTAKRGRPKKAAE